MVARAHTYTHVHTRTHSYTHVHTRTHTYTHEHTHTRSHKRTIPDEAVTTKLRQIGATEPRTNRPIPECTHASLTVAQSVM